MTTPAAKARYKRYKLRCKEKGIDFQADWVGRNRVHVNELGRVRNANLKNLIITTYSLTNPPSCAWCGIDDMEVLCIDHVNNNGAEHRKQIRLLGYSLYQWLKKKDCPKGYQVLCHNCNHKKKLRHDEEKRRNNNV